MTSRVDRARKARDLSGAAASVLVALLLAAGPVTAVDLSRDWTGMSVPTVQNGLDRLLEYGLVTNYGKFEGWGLNFEQLRLWQGHSGLYLNNGDTEKATQQTGGFVASPNQATQTEGYVATSNGTHSSDEKTKKFSFPLDQTDQTDLDLNQSETERVDQTDLICVLEFLEIRDPGRRQLLDADVPADVLYGWYLWCLEQPWVKSVTGWAIRCSLRGSCPSPKYLSIAKRQIARGELDPSELQVTAVDDHIPADLRDIIKR